MRRSLLFVVVGLVAALLALLGGRWWAAGRGSKVGSPIASQPPTPRAPPDARVRPWRAALADRPAGDDEAVITGRVVRADTGAAVPDATVVARAGGEDSTRAGPDGRFRLGGLHGGRWKPIAHAPGLFGAATTSVWVDVGHVSSELAIALHPAADIVARVELARSGAPCPGANLHLGSSFGEWLRETADDAGELAFTLPPGRYQVRLDCPGKAQGEEAAAIEIGDAPRSLTFVVHDKLAIAGVAVDEDGQPVPLLEIAASRHGGGEVASSVADHEGAFEILVAEPGTYDVTAADWSGRVEVAPVLASAPASGVRVVARASSHVRGRVVDERGGSVKATVHASGTSQTHEASCGVNDDGGFDIAVARPGRLHLDVEVAGARLPLVSGDGDPIVPVARPITLVVSPPPRLGGTVLGANGPASRVHVQVSCPPDGARSDAAQTDESGGFTVFVPDPGCLVYASNDIGETTEPKTIPSGVGATLRLRASATLRGTVRPAPTVFAVRIWGRPGREESFFGTSGAWEMSGLGAGDNHVQVWADGWEGEANVTLSPGETRAVQVDLAPRPRAP